MSASAALKSREKLVRKQLEEIDPRLGHRPEAHPLATKIAKGKDALIELIELVEDSNAEVEERLLALEAISAILAREGEDGMAQSVLRLIASSVDQHPQLRGAAARAMLIAGDKPFIKAFEARLASDDARLVASAAHSMGVARYEPAVEALIELFANHPAIAVQSKAVWALGEIGASRAIEILEAGFRAQRCLMPVIEALGKVGTMETLAQLTLALRDDDADIRLTTAEAMHRLILRHMDDDHGALERYLLMALEAEDDSRIGVVLISCLRQIGANIPKKLVQKALTVSLRKTGSISQARTS
ncbi:MAG: HEAT repeat domain-containing protein [Deltaproteobacteria bacterium]|jgi:HEAT repeat protein|nr:HEAT repeat domain-containing protein [Deltaproteobacteria bacterium]MBT6432830.1 HEAT repeat domain-containing protein [Deltaproteobacteria bacterium]MBT6489707.1 HEAT repeat domain-containing protein [Deltaproteobacteria bacterium]